MGGGNWRPGSPPTVSPVTIDAFGARLTVLSSRSSNGIIRRAHDAPKGSPCHRLSSTCFCRHNHASPRRRPAPQRWTMLPTSISEGCDPKQRQVSPTSRSLGTGIEKTSVLIWTIAFCLYLHKNPFTSLRFMCICLNFHRFRETVFWLKLYWF